MDFHAAKLLKEQQARDKLLASGKREDPKVSYLHRRAADWLTDVLVLCRGAVQDQEKREKHERRLEEHKSIYQTENTGVIADITFYWEKR